MNDYNQMWGALRNAVNQTARSMPWLGVPAIMSKPIVEAGLAGLGWGAGATKAAASGYKVDPGPSLYNMVNIYGLGGPAGGLTSGGAKAAPWFSAVGRAIESSPLKSAPGSQWAGTIKNTPSVKQEELEWTGLLSKLNEEKGLLTKEALQDYWGKNQVDVQEVVKQRNNTATLDAMSQQMFGRDYDDPSLVERSRMAVRQAVGGELTDTTKFSQYQMPGGENYRELLLTLPEKGKNPEVAEFNALVKKSFDEDGLLSSDAARLHELGTKLRSAGLLNEDGTAAQSGVTFQSGHYDEPNVLAHVRFNDRVDASGKKTLFLEEIQSDWHQKGRKEGYSGPPPEKFTELPDGATLRPALSGERQKSIMAAAARKEYDRVIAAHNETSGVAAGREHNIPQDIVEADTRVLDAFSQNSLPEKADFDKWLAYVRRDVPDAFVKDDPYRGAAGQKGFAVVKDGQRITWARTAEEAKSVAIERLYEKALEAHRNGVPDAPFKTTWPELSLKRMIKWAADNGYDQIAWTPGKVQAERYDLSKQISEIHWDAKTERLVALPKEGTGTAIDRKVKKEDLPDYIGKEAADRLLNNPSKTYQDRHVLRGLDLQVGGEGMKAFYDKMLVNAANKLGKKYGAKVGVTKIDARPKASAAQRADFEAHATPAEMAKYGSVSEVWSLPITEAMKKEVTEKGMPLFSGGRGGSLASILQQALTGDKGDETLGGLLGKALGDKAR